MQKVTLIGNLGKDPEERTTTTGKKVISFSLAVTVKKDETVWYDCQIWENRMSLFSGLLPHLKKGSRVIIGGDLKMPTTYQTKMGETKIKLQCEPFYINFVGGGEKKENNPLSTSVFQSEPTSLQSALEDEIPF